MTLKRPVRTSQTKIIPHRDSTGRRSRRRPKYRGKKVSRQLLHPQNELFRSYSFWRRLRGNVVPLCKFNVIHCLQCFQLQDNFSAVPKICNFSSNYKVRVQTKMGECAFLQKCLKMGRRRDIEVFCFLFF